MLISFLIASITYPKGYGMFLAGEVILYRNFLWKPIFRHDLAKLLKPFSKIAPGLPKIRALYIAEIVLFRIGKALAKTFQSLFAYFAFLLHL